MDYKRYFLPGVFAGVVFGAVLGSSFLPEFFKKKAPEKEDPPAQIIHVPHGRALYIVIEADGFYVGKEFIPFLDLLKYLKEREYQFRPDYVIICGVSSSSFGHAVEALEATKAVFSVPYTFETMTVPEGTRRGPIEIHENPWEY